MKSVLIAIVIATVGVLYYIHKEFPSSNATEETVEETYEVSHEKVVETKRKAPEEKTEVKTPKVEAVEPTVEPTVVVGTPEPVPSDNKEFFKERHKRNFERYQTLKAQIKEEILQNQNGLMAADGVRPNFKEGRIRTSDAQREAWKAQKAKNVQAWRYKVDRSKERLNELEKAWRDVEAQYKKDLQ